MSDSHRPTSPIQLGRRALLTGTMAGLAAAAIGQPAGALTTLEDAEFTVACRLEESRLAECSRPSGQSDWIGSSGWKLRFRSGYQGNNTADNPALGDHPSVSTFPFHAGFRGLCNGWATFLDGAMKDALGEGIDWVGSAGTFACVSGQHGTGSAFDLTRINGTGNALIDMNRHWRPGQSMADRRRYIGVMTSCRMYFRVVLNGWHDTDGTHDNHIHIDNAGSTSRIALRSSPNNRTDTTIVQVAARFLGVNSDIDIDRIWGPITQHAFQDLRSAFGMSDRPSPIGNTLSTSHFLQLIVRTALANGQAGDVTVGDL